jgi:predicted DNA-binding transcriptional regulator AlpA
MATIEADTAVDFQPMLICAEDVARLLNMSMRTIWRMRSAGDIPPPVRIGCAVRWNLDEIRAWIADGCPTAKQRQARKAR